MAWSNVIQSALGANTSNIPATDFYQSTTTENWIDYARQMQQNHPLIQEMLRQQGIGASSTTPDNTLILIKKSIKEIKREAVSKEAQENVQGKIDRLERLGVKAQATILRAELQLRIKLAKVLEWDYKVLPYEAIKDYDGKTINSWTIRVHIDELDKYVGANENTETEAKDKIIPDFVLDKIEEARDRQVFDDYKVLWVEEVKDPLLLGCLTGCKDYFLICEWGEDVKFDTLINPKKGDKNA